MDGLEEIIERVRERNCVPFIGAGISKIAGCSGWESIPQELESTTEIKQALSQNSELVPPNASNEQKIEIYLRELKSQQKSYVYEQIIAEAINCDPEEVLGKYLITVKALERIFSFSKILMTTNVDNCLELAKGTVFLPRKTRIYFKTDEFDIRNLGTGGVFHIHGHRNHLEETVFSDGAFIKRYQNIGFTNFLCHVFKTYTFLFVGYGLADKQLMEILEKMKYRTHYALVREGKFSAAKKTDFLEKYNIKIVEYPNHDSLPELLRQWVDSNFPEVVAQSPEEEDVTHVT